MKVCIVIGTRPEIIKMSPLIRACQNQKLDFFILHTGQHFSPNMDSDIFNDLELPKPKYNLKTGGIPYNLQISQMIQKMSEIFIKERPKVVFVQGDTNSVLAGALAANKLTIQVGHHEAGLRSHDLSMPEEVNRILTDNISDFLFVPTKDVL